MAYGLQSFQLQILIKKNPTDYIVIILGILLLNM